jgi:hypothetical protein
MKTQTPFKRLILRAELRKVSPMVIRVLAVADYLNLSSFDEVFPIRRFESRRKRRDHRLPAALHVGQQVD